MSSSGIFAKNIPFATGLSPDETSETRPVPNGTKDLIRKVTYEGNTLHQSVDNQQGQVTDQFVGPDGIRNIVHRNGVVIVDQLVTAQTESSIKQLLS